MITNIWLKSQPNKKIAYPDCFPNIYPSGAFVNIQIRDKYDVTCSNELIAEYNAEALVRIEFRP